MGIRLFIIAFLAVVLLIPSFFIQSLISERENRRDSVIDGISEKWGGEQVIIGPVVTIPYRHWYERDGKDEQMIGYAHFLPEDLNIKGSIDPEIRYRGIYKVIVYSHCL